MQQLQEWIAIEYLVVAAVVLALLFVITLTFRLLAGRGGSPESSRLGVSEYLEVDKQRRLILVRRDNVEHLVLIGGGQDLVIEAPIQFGASRREDAPAAPRVMPGDRLQGEREHPQPVARRPQPVNRPVPLRAGRPPVFGDQASEPAQAPAERTEPRLDALRPEEKSREA